MNLTLIPRGEIVLLDANVVLYGFRHESHECDNLLGRCSERDITCLISSTQLAEVMHRLMIAEARDNGWITGGNPAKQLAEKPDRIRSMSRSEKGLKSLLAIGVSIEPVIREDFLSACALQRLYGLMTNDALLVAVAGRLRVRAVASADARLKDIDGIILYSPDDLR